MITTYPDARISKGVIMDFATGDQLPNYEGLIYSGAAGKPCILYTWIDVEGKRQFDYVHQGGVLLLGEIEKYMKGKRAA